ncbi:YczE/YyaS/YitT family protein [Paenibacillus camerounensis]|uniref:YczE/YyaS/YitT family protein n=1 Tax=Paenibacillus camerounensis TaxID=1243663 RepID=UPI0005A86254|nr:membrane protein [Paenibacillus camerounensis]
MNRLRLLAGSLFIGGLLILTLGISLTIQSGLGASPFDATLVGLSGNVGLTVGSWEILIAVLLLICNSFLSRTKPEVLGLATAFVTGLGIDMWLYMLNGRIEPEPLGGRVVCFVLGLIVTGLGTAIYLHAKFAPSPLDRLTLLLQKLTGRSILLSRTLIYFVFLVAAFIFNGPIGIGTLLTVCLGGFILNFFMPVVQKALDKDARNPS